MTRSAARARVPGQHVPTPSSDVGGPGEAVYEAPQAFGHILALEGLARTTAGKGVEVTTLGRVEPQGAGKRLDGVDRRRHGAPLLKANVPFGADASEAGDLLAQQARRAPCAAYGEACGARGKPRAARAQENAELAIAGYGILRNEAGGLVSVKRGMTPIISPSDTRIVSTLQASSCAPTCDGDTLEDRE